MYSRQRKFIPHGTYTDTMLQCITEHCWWCNCIFPRCIWPACQQFMGFACVCVSWRDYFHNVGYSQELGSRFLSYTVGYSYIRYNIMLTHLVMMIRAKLPMGRTKLSMAPKLTRDPDSCNQLVRVFTRVIWMTTFPVSCHISYYFLVLFTISFNSNPLMLFSIRRKRSALNVHS